MRTIHVFHPTASVTRLAIDLDSVSCVCPCLIGVWELRAAFVSPPSLLQNQVLVVSMYW